MKNKSNKKHDLVQANGSSAEEQQGYWDDQWGKQETPNGYQRHRAKEIIKIFEGFSIQQSTDSRLSLYCWMDD